jgi:hypothetical protein
MKTITFKNEINIETIDELIAQIETIEPGEEKTIYKVKGSRKHLEFYERTIYFSSFGGEMCAAEILIDFINNTRNFLFNFVFFWENSSAAFEIMSRLLCEKRLMNDCFSVIHISTSEYSSRDLLKRESIQKHVMQEHKKLIKQQIDSYRTLGIEDQLLKKLSRGEDVFLNREKLISLFFKNEEIDGKNN